VRGVFGSLTTAGPVVRGRGRRGHVCGLAIPEPDLVRVGRAAGHPAARVRADRAAGPGTGCPARAGWTRRGSRPASPHGVPHGWRTCHGCAPACCWPRTSSRTRWQQAEVSCWTRSSPVVTGSSATRSRSDSRGKFTIGPLRVRVADSFGLVEISGRSAPPARWWSRRGSTRCPGPPRRAGWLGEGDGGMRTISRIGEDDAAPRLVHSDGDGLHRVHWKSTARYGELMVRREEHQWRNSASVFLDTRRAAHAGTGPRLNVRVRGQRGRPRSARTCPAKGFRPR